MNNLSTLRVEGKDQAVYALLSNLQEAAVIEQVTGKWKKGDLYKFRGHNKHRQTAGFIATIHDDASPAGLVAALRKFLTDCEKYEIQFSRPDLSVELSIGVMVGDSKQFMAFVDFEPADLALLAKLGIHLSIAAYPVADEDNEEDKKVGSNRLPSTGAQALKEWKADIKSMSARHKAFFRVLYEEAILNAPSEPDDC